MILLATIDCCECINTDGSTRAVMIQLKLKSNSLEIVINQA